jgi:hypothetical protein
MSLIVLAMAIYARYSRRLAGAWRRIYVVTALIAFYLNVLVLIVRLFEKVPALKVMAPTQSEAPFKAAQLLALVVFVLLTVFAALRFRDVSVRPA